MTADEKMLYQEFPATKNKWYADIPLSLISHDFKDVTLKLQDFHIPRIQVSQDTIKFRGVDVYAPTRVFNPNNKFITFKYLIDARWESYLALYQWANCYTSIDNPTPQDSVRQNDREDAFWTIPIRVYLLDEMKKTTINIVYYGCMLKEFGEFNLSYITEPDIVPHDFQVSYTRLEIARQNPLERIPSSK